MAFDANVYLKKYYQNNRKKILEYSKKYRQENKQKIKDLRKISW